MNAVLVMQQQLQVGQIDFNQYATIRQNLIQAQDLGAQSRGEIVFALIHIYRALDGGWEMAYGTPFVMETSADEEVEPGNVQP